MHTRVAEEHVPLGVSCANPGAAFIFNILSVVGKLDLRPMLIGR
jgi:hypothetical protein